MKFGFHEKSISLSCFKKILHQKWWKNASCKYLIYFVSPTLRWPINNSNAFFYDLFFLRLPRLGFIPEWIQSWSLKSSKCQAVPPFPEPASRNMLSVEETKYINRIRVNSLLIGMIQWSSVHSGFKSFALKTWTFY